MGTKTLMTVEQFLELPDEKLLRHELWQGELIEVGDTILAHNWIREKLVFLITTFLLHSNLGGEVFAETGIRFDSNTLVRPDVSYWDAEHLAAIDWLQSPVEIPPQLLAEVVSPSNSLKRLFESAKYYLRAGVRVVWIVRPRSVRDSRLREGPSQAHPARRRLIGSPVRFTGILGESLPLHSACREPVSALGFAPRFQPWPSMALARTHRQLAVEQRFLLKNGMT